jgi:hypothetical protein
MEKITVITDGRSIEATKVLDVEGNPILRVQEVHVAFETWENRPHGYITRMLENEDGSPKWETELDKDGNRKAVLLTEDVDFIELRLSE